MMWDVLFNMGGSASVTVGGKVLRLYVKIRWMWS